MAGLVSQTALDASVKETSVCIVDDTGKVVREVRVAVKWRLLRGRDLLAIAAGNCFDEIHEPTPKFRVRNLHEKFYER